MSVNPPLHAHIVGTGIPVLAVHGWTMSGTVEALDFEPIFADVLGYKRIYVDLPGMGKSPADGVDSLDAMYLRLLDFVKGVIGTGRFLLMGSSCGAYLCRALVHDFSNQIDGVLLRVPLIEAENAKRALDPFQLLISNPELMASLDATDAQNLHDIIIQTPAYINSMRQRMQAPLDAIAESDAVLLSSIRENPSRYHLSRPLDCEQGFPAPTLILCGRHDSVVGYRDAFHILEKYHRASFVVLDRGVHDMPVDEGDLFTSLVRDWLVRVREWQASRKV